MGLDGLHRDVLGTRYSVLGSPVSPLGVGPAVTPLGTSNTNNPDGIVDKRAAATFVYYPQPLGFQAEWTVGRGPGLNEPKQQSSIGHYTADMP